MTNPTFFAEIRDLISRDELPAALEQLLILLEHSPKLDEVLHQSGRFENIRKQIRLGLVSYSEATLTLNRGR
jgi:Effector-associated domain 11